MPTTSQCQILQTLVKAVAPVQKNIAAKLETIDINDGEEDIFGLKDLKTKFSDAEKRSITPGKDGKPDGLTTSMENKRIIPSLSKRVRSQLYVLGFRNSEPSLNSNAMMPSGDKKEPNTDDIIKELLSYHQNTVPMKKRDPPELKPRALCFNYPGPQLTHLDVKRAIDCLMAPYPEVKMVSIQFQPRRKLLRPDRKENTCRWVINMNTEWGQRRLINKEFKLRGVSVVLKRYNEIVELEYKQYGRMTEIMQIVKNT